MKITPCNEFYMNGRSVDIFHLIMMCHVKQNEHMFFFVAKQATSMGRTVTGDVKTTAKQMGTENCNGAYSVKTCMLFVMHSKNYLSNGFHTNSNNSYILVFMI